MKLKIAANLRKEKKFSKKEDEVSLISGSGDGKKGETVKFSTKLAFGVGASPAALANTVIGFFFTPFLLEVAGVWLSTCALTPVDSSCSCLCHPCHWASLRCPCGSHGCVLHVSHQHAMGASAPLVRELQRCLYTRFFFILPRALSHRL